MISERSFISLSPIVRPSTAFVGCLFAIGRRIFFHTLGKIPLTESYISLGMFRAI